jgi:ABC-2 type transport system permease protein
MGRLVTAEFRKILTTRMWWALLLPAAVLAFGWSSIAALLTSEVAQGVRDAPELQGTGLTFQNAPWSVVAQARAINVSTLFPMLFGALGVSGELNRRTITTTFLTAPNRSSLIGAKGIAYAVWGVIYGVVISLLALLGTLTGAQGQYLPSAGGFLLVAVAGVIASVLWTLFGLGVGALIGSTTATVILLALYAAVAEPVVDLALHNGVATGLPNGSADGLPGGAAGQIIIDNLNAPVLGRLPQDNVNQLHDLIQAAAGAVSGLSWWLSGVIFLAWAGVAFGAGMFVTQQRDIS